ncbi:ABC transporter permease [Hungatella hathewayi]|uniref:ABC transporter permease n=1 Tax=Hungatella hathewayi TaxID=154046 RepID=UPI003564BDED
MKKYILKRLLWMIPVILGVTIAIFTIMYFVPGDPAVIILGAEATEAELQSKREALGLNRPFLIQLGSYMKNVFLHFDFGTSYITNNSITKELLARLPRTALVGFVSMLLMLIVGIPLGITAAVHQNGIGDRICMIIALAGVSVPSFWLGLLLVITFALNLGILPASGIGGFQYYILPCVASAFGGIAGLARQSRSSMLEVIRSDYVVTARAKGLSERSVIYGHALPNALIPIITVAGSHLAHIFGGSVVIENVFSIPGIGSYMVTAVNNRDYTVVTGSVIFLAVVFSLVMLLVDIVYAFVDPRIKAQYINGKKRRGK